MCIRDSKTTDLIRQLEQSVQRNEALLTSRKKAVHTITHELRTPLTAITVIKKYVSAGPTQDYGKAAAYSVMLFAFTLIISCLLYTSLYDPIVKNL